MLWFIDTSLLSQSQFFGMALLGMVGLILYLANRADFEPFKAIFLLTFVLGCAAVGGRVLAFMVDPYHPQPFNPLTPGYASLGAAVGVIVGLLPLWRFHARFWEIADVLAPTLFFGLGITRLGCLFQGCDFGVPFEPGVVYAQTSQAWAVHVDLGRIALNSSASLSTFPLPIALGASSMVAALVAWFPATPGVPAARAVVIYFALRAFFEIFRAMPPDYDYTWANPNIWVSLAAAVIAVGLLQQRTKAGQ